MTVCVATLTHGGILGASDRMLTAADVEFEPALPKILPFSNSIVAMSAGDSSLQAEILQDVFIEITGLIKANPENWVRVKDAAFMYLKYRNEAKLKRAESAILHPLGLDRNSFIEKQKQMAEGLVDQLTKELINFELPPLEAIITGVEGNGGGHIYVIEDGRVSCHDSIGFASIGIGARHALSYLMFNGHTPLSQLPDTLLVTYMAKKRAEVAPGVGSATDMFMIGRPGGYTTLNKDVLQKLESIYETTKTMEDKAMKQARKDIQSYVDELSKQAPEQEQTAPSPAEREKTVNRKSVPNDPKKG